ncbi:sigma-70 family RNA polymerase sigma factor [Blastococcus sp. TF02A-30]|uniref:sigma-70 family RNA polymerase sigma factor n=1 Tax=Blastococcus sp. TF02A-30 TaxID=2250580 RepID=UPI000DEBA10B|nr:sigma-70 family RNA polymerase sigma factor [Blastococcus sp. TF02A-30]RBY93048.1 RNA polymerase subunit sigma-70 [Blastococcus sp. TF02A-30]
MPHPLDAERPAAAPARRPSPHARPRPRPTPFPRPSAEPFPRPSAEALRVEEPNVAAEAPAVADAPVVEAPAPEDGQPDVWGMVRRAQDGDAEAFGELYDHYVSLVHRYVYHRVGDRATAEDVTSETFVRALRRIDSLSFQGRDVGAWLVTIARNIILDHVKSSRYRLEVATADMRDADRATDGPEDAVVAHLTNQQLLACVQQLGSEQQECIVLRFIHGLSVAETAEIMGKKDGAIKALQHRAVRRLAALIPDGLR